MGNQREFLELMVKSNNVDFAKVDQKMTNPTLPDWLTKAPYRLQNCRTGDNSPDLLFIGVGKITHQWECLEVSLMTLFMTLVGAKDVGPMMVYGSVLSSSSRCDMIIAAAQAFGWVNKKAHIPQQTAKIVEKIKKLVASRNVCAHGQIYVECADNRLRAYSANHRELAPSNTFVLAPAAYNTNKTTNRLAVKIWYSSAELSKIAEAIESLQIEVEEFTYYELQGHPAGKFSHPLSAINSKNI